MTADELATVLRGLPLTVGQVAAADEVLTAPVTDQVPAELIRREVLTEYQAKLILEGRAAELTVGRYVVLDELGGGGMGQVFKVRDTGMDRIVALKLIRPDRVASETIYSRFQQEIRAAARLAHPNIVRAYDAGTANGKHFLVTELVNGHDLGRELSRRGALPPGEACEYTRQAAVGLQHAHEKGLTHRDIKPSNLLFSTTERLVKIADFGLARLGDTEHAGLTASGAVFGTPDYMAPEQANSATAADIRSDIYSLGCTLYQFLTGHVPFPGETALGKLVAHASQEPEPLDDACPGLNPALVAVVRKMMAKNPADRYQTPLEVVDALIPFCPKSKTSLGTSPSRQLSASFPAVVPGTATPGLTSLGEKRGVPPPLPSSLPAPESQSQPALLSAPTLIPPLAPLAAERAMKRWALIGAGLLALVVLAVTVGVIVPMLNRAPKDDTTKQTDPPAIPPAPAPVPVTVTVKLEDWARAKEPGVVIQLGERVVTPADLSKPLPLPPGRYTLILKKDGKEIEARTFDVTPESADKVVATRPAPIPDPVADPGEVRRWGAGGIVTDLAAVPDGARFAVVTCTKNPYTEGPARKGVFTYASDLLGSSTAAVYQLTGKDKETVPLWTTSDPVYRTALLPGHNVALRFQYRFYAKETEFVATAVTLDKGTTSGAGAITGNPIQAARPTVCVGSPTGDALLWSARRWNEPPTGGGEVELHAVTAERPGVPKLTIKNRFPGSTGCFDPSANRVLVANDRVLTFWDRETGKPLAPSYDGPTAGVICVAVAPDGKRLAAATTDGTVYIWTIGTKAPAAVGKGHAGTVHAIGFAFNGARVVTAGEDGTVRVWNAADGKEVQRYKHDGAVYALAVSPGGTRVLSGGADKTVRLWQLAP
jgi:serine/threonine protein kinase